MLSEFVKTTKAAVKFCHHLHKPFSVSSRRQEGSFVFGYEILFCLGPCRSIQTDNFQYHRQRHRVTSKDGVHKLISCRVQSSQIHFLRCRKLLAMRCILTFSSWQLRASSAPNFRRVEYNNECLSAATCQLENSPVANSDNSVIRVRSGSTSRSRGTGTTTCCRIQSIWLKI